jgi:hypothetical protein
MPNPDDSNLPTRARETETVGQISLDGSPELLLLLLWNEFRLIVVSLELLVGTANILPIGGALCAATAAATFAASISLRERHRLVKGTPHIGQIETHAHLLATSFAHFECKFCEGCRQISVSKKKTDRATDYLITPVGRHLMPLVTAFDIGWRCKFGETFLRDIKVRWKDGG